MELEFSDVSSSGFGQPWAHTRRYRNRFDENFDVGNGVNWQVVEWPYAIHDDTTVTLVRSDGSLWFDILGGGSYAPKFGVLQQLSGGGFLTLTFPDGSQEIYYDFGTGATSGFLYRTIPASGLYVTTLLYDGAHVTTVRRYDGFLFEQYEYEYGTLDDADHVISVTLRRSPDDITWTDVRRAVYEYYQVSEDFGTVGDLKTVTRQVPDGSSGWLDNGTCYYRYYKSDETEHGFTHGLKYVLNPAAFDRLAALEDPLEAIDETLALYADKYFEYDPLTQEIILEAVAGGTEVYGYEYDAGGTDGPDVWKFKTTETLPDGSVRIVYTNRLQQLLLSDHQGGSQAERWLQYQKINSNYQVEYVAESTAFDMPPSGDPYDDNEADLDVQLKSDVGLIRYNDYYDGIEGPEKYLKSQWISEGLGGTRKKQLELEYTSNTDSNGQTVYPVSKRTVYRDEAENPSDAIETSYAYTFHSGTNMVQEATTTLPLVSTAENGPDEATESREYFDMLGFRIWAQDPRGAIDYFSYDPTTGALLQQVRDYDGSDPLPPWSRGGDLPTALNLVTDYDIDDIGRTIRTLGPPHALGTDVIRTVQWMLYLDDQRENRSANGYVVGDAPYDATVLVNPVSISKYDYDGHTTDQIQAVAAVTNAPPEPTDTYAQSTWTRWTTTQIDDDGRTGSSRVYHTIPSLGSGSSGTNYDQATFGYDVMGQQNRVVSPGGTITRTVFDPLDRTLSTWIGTDDTDATDDDPTGGGASGNNMRQVSAATYFDNNDAGVPAETRQLVDGTSGHDRVATNGIDYRNRVTDVTAPERSFEHRTYDNLDRVVERTCYVDDVEGAPIASIYTSFDAQGRVYKTEHSGYETTSPYDETAKLTSLTWFDAAGNRLKQVAAGAKDLRAFTKNSYDGAGRTTATYVGLYVGTLPEAYEVVSSVAADIVFEQSEPVYDEAGQVLEATSYRRYPSDVATIGPLDTGLARRSRTASWYDGIGRSVASINYGTVGTSRPDEPPASSDEAPVTLMSYDDAGNPFETTDPLGRVAHSNYDAAGRLTESIANYTHNSPGSDTDVTVRRTYDADGHLETLVAVNSDTGDQTTTYFYGVAPGDGSELDSNDLPREVAYPDSSSGTDRGKYAYNRQGEAITMTDQNGTLHAYDYDSLGRRTADRVTLAFGSAIDDAVLRLETAYDERQRIASVTSYDAATSGSVVNQVAYERNAFGQTTKEYQSHAGAVNLMTTPYVGYEHDGGSANTTRPTKLVYPDGRELNYDYGASDAPSDLWSRVASLIDDDGTSVLAAYDYLGVGAIVRCDYVEPEVRWDLSPTGDDFDGLDPLDRVIDNLWYDYGSSADADRIQYTYDANGNRLSRKNVVAGGGNDELYAYDPIDRLVDMQRGDLNLDRDAITSLDFAQEWALDATGNWNGFQQNDDGTGGWDLTQTRTANEVNEITGISGGSWVVPVYDAAGNMTTLPQPETPTASYDATYDAWNRLVKLVDGMTTVAEYAYDPATRRITVDDGSAVRHAYFNARWRNLEDRIDASTDAERQFVWGQRYIDDLVLRDRMISTPLDERLYALQDANWNVDAVVGANGDVQERYRYSAYGTPTFLDASFTLLSPNESGVEWETLFAGYRYDSVNGLYYVRWRRLNAILGNWLTKDPLASDINCYRYAINTPVSHLDPTGLITFKVDRQACIIELHATVQLIFKDSVILGATKTWTDARKAAFTSAYKRVVETAFSSPANIRIFPDKPGGPWNPKSCCPCSANGFSPQLKLSIYSASGWSISEDFEADVAANPNEVHGGPGSETRWDWAYINEKDVNPYQSIDALPGHPQIVAVHEFGHWLELHHPARDLPGFARNTPPEYTYKGNDVRGNEVNGRVDLMGIGNGLRPFYFEQWASQLDAMYSRCLCKYTPGYV